MRNDRGFLSRLLGVALVLSVVGAAMGGTLYALRRSEHWSTHRSAELTPRDIALRSFASVVSIAMKTPSGRQLSLGSGFVADAGVVATNFHVIRGAGSGAVRLVGDSEWHPIEGTVAVDDDLDLVLLSIPTLKAAPLPLGDNSASAIGDKIYVVSNPQDLEGTFSEGIISGKRKLDDVRLLQITAPISGGSSGGPVLDGEARVVGVATSSLRDGQNLNFAITADHLAKLLAAKGAPQELAKVTRPPKPPPAVVARGAAPGPTYYFRRFKRFLGIP